MLKGTGSLRMGEPLTVVIDLEGLNQVPGAYVGIELRSDFDQKLATFSAPMKPARAAHPRSHREELVFELGELPVQPGRYWINVGVWDPSQNRFADRVERAASFDVTSANVYGSGYSTRPEEGALFIDFQWELRPSASGNGASADAASVQAPDTSENDIRQSGQLVGRDPTPPD
jgi:hypothetical protein